MLLSRGGGLGWRITHWGECEHLGLAERISDVTEERRMVDGVHNDKTDESGSKLLLTETESLDAVRGSLNSVSNETLET